MKKFIKGTFVLVPKITNEDFEKFEDEHKEFLEKICDWADVYDFSVAFGLSDADNYVCQYKVKANTKKSCREYVNILKKMLKKEFPKTDSIIEISGECIY